METKKIRIGNDIRLAVDLRQYIKDKNPYLYERRVYFPGDDEFERLDDNEFVNKKTELYYPPLYDEDDDNQNGSGIAFDPSNIHLCIREVKAILINTSLQKKLIDKHRKESRFIGRFPVEPGIPPFYPTHHDLCCSGFPGWRAYPGFGVYPHWGALYHRMPKVNPVEYQAEAMATNKQNVVEVMFPAEAQLYTGKYKLVIVAKVFAPGFNNKNLKTVTLDVPDVFELVGSTEEGIDTGFKINVSEVIDILPDENYFYTPPELDVFVNEGEIGDNHLLLNRTDSNVVDVDLSSVVGWHDED